MKDSTDSLLDALVRHRPYLTRYAYSKLRHKGAAEDVVQEALMAAVEGRSKFKGDSAPLTWLIGILKHKIVDWQRREARNPTRVTAPARIETDVDYMEIPDALFDEDGRWVNPPSEWANPEQAFENREFWEMLEGCLAELPAATARAFYLREIQGLETKEICTELSISESNCWVMLHRARMSLREKIGERWFDRGGQPSMGESRTRRTPNESRTWPLAREALSPTQWLRCQLVLRRRCDMCRGIRTPKIGILAEVEVHGSGGGGHVAAGFGDRR